MKAFQAVAVAFAAALVDGRWEDARELLSPELQRELSASALAATFTGMFSGYADGSARNAHFDPEFSMEDWPARQGDDAGWAYVGIIGDNFVEAVTVIVAATPNGLLIRDIEWGRP